MNVSLTKRKRFERWEWYRKGEKREVKRNVIKETRGRTSCFVWSPNSLSRLGRFPMRNLLRITVTCTKLKRIKRAALLRPFPFGQWKVYSRLLGHFKLINSSRRSVCFTLCLPIAVYGKNPLGIMGVTKSVWAGPPIVWFCSCSCQDLPLAQVPPSFRVFFILLDANPEMDGIRMITAAPIIHSSIWCLRKRTITPVDSQVPLAKRTHRIWINACLIMFGSVFLRHGHPVWLRNFNWRGWFPSPKIAHLNDQWHQLAVTQKNQSPLTEFLNCTIFVSSNFCLFQ